MHRTKLRSGDRIKIIGNLQGLPKSGEYRVKGVSERYGNFMYTLVGDGTVIAHFTTDIDFCIGKAGADRIEVVND